MVQAWMQAQCDSDIIANDAGIVIRHMQADQILYIRAFTDGDVIHIASRHDARPYTRILSDPDIAGKEYLWSHKRIGSICGIFPLNSSLEKVYI